MRSQEELALRVVAKVEAAYASRCSTTADCSRKSYENCLSEFPKQTCEGGQLEQPACGTCDALWDWTTSSVSLAGSIAQTSDGNPVEPQVKETVCYTREPDAAFIAETEIARSS